MFAVSTFFLKILCNLDNVLIIMDKNYHHGDLSNALISAARQLILQKGPNAFSLREVAKLAGVSHTAPYRHFKDKEELLAAIAELGFRRLAEAMDNINNSVSDPELQFYQCGHAYVELAMESPEITQLMFGGYMKSHEQYPALGESASRAFNGLLRLIENGKQAGLYKDQDTQLLAMTLWSMVHGFSMLAIGKQMPEQWYASATLMQEMVNSVNNLLLHGMAKD